MIEAALHARAPHVVLRDGETVGITDKRTCRAFTADKELLIFSCHVSGSHPGIDDFADAGYKFTWITNIHQKQNRKKDGHAGMVNGVLMQPLAALPGAAVLPDNWFSLGCAGLPAVDAQPLSFTEKEFIAIHTALHSLGESNIVLRGRRFPIARAIRESG